MTLVTRYLHRAPFHLDALRLDVPVLAEEHPNKAPFRGILTRVDEASTRPPNGSQGHRVLIPRAVAEAAGPSLVGMPVDCSLNLKDHDKKNVIGVIEDWAIEGNDLVVNGYLLQKNYPDEVEEIRSKREQLGMSYEVSDVTVEDTDASVWTLTGLTFTGAAILRKSAAAYQDTAIAAQGTEEPFMPGEAKEILDELKTLGKRMDDLAAAQDDDEDAACKDEEAANAGDAEAATRVAARQAAAKQAEEETAQAKRDEEEAARKVAEEEDEEEEDASSMLPALFAMMLRGRGKKASSARKAEDDDTDDMAKMFGHMFLRSMAYPGSVPSQAKRKADAAHDDEAEDTALFKRLLQQYTKMDASGRDDLEARRVRRELRELRAVGELITDTLKKQTGLITDLAQQVKKLATDQGNTRGNNGGPVRKTMAAGTLAQFVGPFDGRDGDAAVSLDQINAALDKGGQDVGDAHNVARMAKKLEAVMAGVLKTN